MLYDVYPEIFELTLVHMVKGPSCNLEKGYSLGSNFGASLVQNCPSFEQGQPLTDEGKGLDRESPQEHL